MSLQLFARYAFPPNELGYCGPEDATVLLRAGADAELIRHAKGFAGAWPYLEELAAVSGLDPLDPEVVRTYWVGGPLLAQVDGTRLLSRLRQAMTGQPTGLLADLNGGSIPLSHHSFHVLVVYPWIRFLSAHSDTPIRILQACRIRWGIVASVDKDTVVLESAPLQFDGQHLGLGPTRQEPVRWRSAGVSLVERPRPGDIVSAHWDWVCDILDEDNRDCLATATAATLDLVNRVRSVQQPP